MSYSDILNALGQFSDSKKVDFKIIRDQIKNSQSHCDGTR
jgi:hypothetical protein